MAASSDEADVLEDRHQTFSGRQLAFGAIIFALSITLVLVGLAFPFLSNGKGTWALFSLVAFFLLGGGYGIHEGISRMRKTELTFAGNTIRYRSGRKNFLMSWADVTMLSITQEADDEARIRIRVLGSVLGAGDQKIDLWQGIFSTPQLDEIVRIMKTRAAEFPTIAIRDDQGIWSCWDDYMEAWRKVSRVWGRTARPTTGAPPGSAARRPPRPPPSA